MECQFSTPFIKARYADSLAADSVKDSEKTRLAQTAHAKDMSQLDKDEPKKTSCAQPKPCLTER